MAETIGPSDDKTSVATEMMVQLAFLLLPFYGDYSLPSRPRLTTNLVKVPVASSQLSRLHMELSPPPLRYMERQSRKTRGAA